MARSTGANYAPFLFALLCPAVAASTRSYFIGNGGFSNSCPVSPCSTCAVGQYRLGCANASLGVCANCTRIPNATFTSHGWFNNSCSFQCDEGFAPIGRSCTLLWVQYTVNFEATVTVLNNTNNVFNLTTFIQAVATVAGCGPCGNMRVKPVSCGACSVFYNVSASIPVVYRRLLASGSLVQVDTSIVVNNNQRLASTAASSLTTTSLNAQLASNNIGTVEVTKAPTVTAVTANPAPPPPVPPPVPPPPISTPAPDSGGGNTGAIIGGAVGGVFGLILIVGAVWYFSQKKAQDIQVNQQQQPVTGPPTKPVNGKFVYRTIKRPHSTLQR